MSASATKLPSDVREISTIGQLCEYEGKIVYYSTDTGQTWQYGKVGQLITIQGLGSRIDIDLEVTTKGVHRFNMFCGSEETPIGPLLIRNTTLEETVGLKFSYELEWSK